MFIFTKRLDATAPCGDSDSVIEQKTLKYMKYAASILGGLVVFFGSLLMAIFGYFSFGGPQPHSIINGLASGAVTFVVLSITVSVIALLWFAFLSCLRGISGAVRGEE